MTEVVNCKRAVMEFGICFLEFETENLLKF